jgi:H+-transporting ATPase
MPLPELETKLETSPDGPSQAGAQERLITYGPTENTETKTNPFLRFLTLVGGRTAVRT